ncbi:hypothetical protein [Actinomadura litoris]|uniref:hypothetical protein n=1 Tax=Actinomadura litoris TaxID=2678616 RepID=UPI001FA7D7CC|nr:hypothetical protein [Actinomadura litoris]
MKCANCGVEIAPAEDGWTHMPTTFIAECIGGASPTKTMVPNAPDVAECDECFALVRSERMKAHDHWHESKWPRSDT